MNEPIKILTSDPGVTSGYTLANLWPKEKLEFYPFQALDDVDDFWRRLREFKPRYIIQESFEFRQKKQTGINLFPKELIGVARLYSLIADHQCAHVPQTASQGKGYYNNNILKFNGILKHGDITKLGHGLDATRHLLQWITFGAGFQYNPTTGQIKDFVRRLESWPS